MLTDMTIAFAWIRNVAVVAVCAALMAACASNGTPKPPDPGSKKWYEQRIQEIETAKAEGKLTEEEYLSLKSQADDTRQEYISASRYNNAPAVGVGIGFGVGSYHHHHHGGPGTVRPGGPIPK